MPGSPEHGVAIDSRLYHVVLRIGDAHVEDQVDALDALSAQVLLCHLKSIPLSAVDESAASLVTDLRLSLVPRAPLPLFDRDAAQSS